MSVGAAATDHWPLIRNQRVLRDLAHVGIVWSRMVFSLRFRWLALSVIADK